jgi:hypothetical protein
MSGFGGKAMAVLALGAVGVLGIVSEAGAVPVSNACRNSVNANSTQIPTDLSGTSPASVPSGGSVPLTGLQQQVTIPGGVFVVGYNLGLLTVGDNTIPGNLRTVIEGTNTGQSTQTGGPTNFSVTTTITDPDATPGTGDETATDASGTAAYPPVNFTAGASGPLEFREDTVTPLGAPDVGALIVNAVVGGVIPVQFRCSPGTVTGPDPGVSSFIDPAPTFASTQVAAGATKAECASLRKKLKKAKKAKNKAKVKKIKKQIRKLGC